MKDYLLGRRVTLESSLGQADIEAALRENARGWFNPFYTGVVGWCRFGWIGLRWATALWSNGFQPTFSGKLQSSAIGTRLDARFGAPPVLLIFLAIWYFLLAMMFVSVVSAYVDGRHAGSDMLLNLGAIILFLFVPVGFHLLFNRGADRHFESILAFLKEHGGFQETNHRRLG